MKKNEINFSIIVPVYNVENYVKDSLDSIYKAADEDCEIIIIDDCSKDKSREIVEKYIKNIKNQKLKEQTKFIKLDKNTGLSNVKNIGLENAKGKFISYVDSDDKINENFYSEARKYINDYDVIVYDIYVEFEKNDKKFHNYILHVAKEDIEGPILDKLIYGSMQGSSCNKIIKKELYKYKFPTGKEYEDVAVTPFILVDAKNIKYIYNPYYIYLQRKASIVGKNKFDEAYYKICENINKTFQNLDEKDFDKYIKIINEFYFCRIIESLDLSIKENRKNMKQILEDYKNKNEYIINKINDYLENDGKLPDRLTENQKSLVKNLFKYLKNSEYKKCIKLLKMKRWINYFRRVFGSILNVFKFIFKGVYYG